MGKPFFSIVIPVYNVERHLRKAVKSLFEQTVQDFEIILVDDCSPDSCPELCDELAREYDKISVIHHEVNKGLSGARNSGLEIATGRYIWFMDSDDYVENNLLEMAVASVEKNPAKVIVFGLTEDYYDAHDNLHHSVKIKDGEKYFSDKESLRSYVIELENKTLYGYAWNKIYDLDYLKSINLIFEKITLIEDIVFNIKYFMDIDTMNLLDFCGYHYNKRMESSLTSKFLPNYFELNSERVKRVLDQYKYWKMCDEKVQNILANIYVRYVISGLQRNCDKQSAMDHKERKAWLEALYNDSLYNELIAHFKTDNTVLNILGKLLKSKNTGLALAAARFVYIVKTKMPIVFAKLKQNR